MFGINGGELLILIIVAIIVVGPERMPEYARQFREWVAALRTMVDQGRNQIKEEVGNDVDWSKLDPRQYDPRQIVREAFTEPAQSTRPGSGSASPRSLANDAVAGKRANADSAAAHVGPAATAAVRPRASAPHTPRSAGAPFDSEAT